MSRPRSYGGSATQALVELVLDPEEHGYREAARRNGGTPRHHSYDTVAVALGCVAIGFLIALGWVQTHRAAPQAAAAHAQLVDRVRSVDARVQQLTGLAAALGGRLERARAAALPARAALLQDLDRARLAAGELPATGPGIVVRLSDPATTAAPTGLPGPGERTPASGGHILTDRDVRSVVNELWADGAEAIAVNGVRLTPTSAIRFAGDAVLVDLLPIQSPYEIQAIGDPNGIETGLAVSGVASRYQTLRNARGIGFSFDTSDRLALPAQPPATLRYAHPGRGTGR